MTANALVVQKTHLPASQKPLRAAQYVRMSTDRQRYSIQNQAAVIGAYAHAHNLTIVRTYSDEGESGLQIKNRTGLKQLLQDVTSGQANFGCILVYDVSRWGRFPIATKPADIVFPLSVIDQLPKLIASVAETLSDLFVSCSLANWESLPELVKQDLQLRFSNKAKASLFFQ